VTRRDLFVVADAMDDAACRRVQEAMHAGVPEPAEILDGDIALARHARAAANIEIDPDVLDDVERCLDAHRGQIEAFFGEPLSDREGASLLRYEAGGFYRPHVDRADVDAWPAAARRAFTLVLFLNSSRAAESAGEFDGGILRLLPDDGDAVDIVARRGMLVAFRSGVPHEVTPVADGCRDTVVDWLLS
jgi:predicted 2-oxoglutarate/Fe(II)-dependent dioxygenase YbiX